MKKKNKVITINGGEKSWYEKAIFVAKKNNKTIPDDFVDEAEKIIDQYLLRTGFQNANKKYQHNNKIVKNTKIDMFLYYSIIFCCFTLMVCYISLII